MEERPHHSRHGEALEQESFAAVAVPLKDHEVSVMADLASEGPVNQIIICNPKLKLSTASYFI